MVFASLLRLFACWLSLAVLASWQGPQIPLKLSGSSCPPAALDTMWSTAVDGFFMQMTQNGSRAKIMRRRRRHLAP